MSKNFEHLPASFFSSCEGCSLDSAEKTRGWNELRGKLDDLSSAHALEAEAADVRKFFAPCAECLLSPVEKETVRMDLRVSRAASTEIRHEQADRAWPWSFARIFSFSWGMPALALFLLVVGSGISYVSAEALPGEFLYPIKYIQEQISLNLQWSTQSRAENETERVGVRVYEAEKLRERKEKNAPVGEEAEVTLHQEFLIERRQANARVRQLEAEGDTESATRLRARLNAYKDRYEKLSGKTLEVLEGEKEKEENEKKEHGRPLIEATTGTSSSSAVGSSASAQSTEASSSQKSSSAETSVEVEAKIDAKEPPARADTEETVTLPVTVPHVDLK